jgi:hypothetical protein
LLLFREFVTADFSSGCVALWQPAKTKVAARMAAELKTTGQLVERLEFISILHHDLVVHLPDCVMWAQ